MSKPEFLRRDNRLTTAPSQAVPWGHHLKNGRFLFFSMFCHRKKTQKTGVAVETTKEVEKIQPEPLVVSFGVDVLLGWKVMMIGF